MDAERRISGQRERVKQLSYLPTRVTNVNEQLGNDQGLNGTFQCLEKLLFRDLDYLFFNVEIVIVTIVHSYSISLMEFTFVPGL